MFITALLTVALEAATIAHMIAEPTSTITALCGGGTPESFGSGALARTPDGAVFRIEPGALEPGHKISHNVTFVRRLHEMLDNSVFESIRVDKSDGAWCGITRVTKASAHTVRWPTRMQDGGSLRHEFAGVPVEVWHAFLELQRAGAEKELCGPFHDQLVSPADLSGAIWLSCQGPGVNPPAAGIYVLSDGDVLTWTGGPVIGGRCARIAGNEATALARWHSVLSSVRFEKLANHPDGLRYGNVNCSIGRGSAIGKPHVVSLRGVGPGMTRKPSRDPQRRTVEQVFMEIGSRFPADDARLVVALRRAMSSTW